MGFLTLRRLHVLGSVSLLAISSHLSTLIVLCVPPAIVKCNASSSSCVLDNIYGTWPDRSTCDAAAVVYPTTELELVHTVADAVRRGQSVKVITAGGNSIPKWSCPRGRSGLLISTRDYTRSIVVNESAMTVTADSGVRLRQLLDTIAGVGLALPHSPYWEGVTLGGLLSTGSHGSSLFGEGSAVHEYVVGMRLVIPTSSQEGYAKLIVLTERDEELNAAKVSLGVLGVISQVTLALQPQFKRSVTKQLESDADLEDRIISFGMDHEFGDITWYPAKFKVVYSVDDRVPIETAGDGVNDYAGFRPASSLFLKGLRGTEVVAEVMGSTTAKCLLSTLQTAILLGPGNGLRNKNQSFTQYPVIGYQDRIQTSGSCLLDNGSPLVCPWDSETKGLFIHETTLAISLEDIRDFILDVKQLRDIDPSSLCGLDLYTGFLMRFVRGSTAYLGHKQDAVDIDIAYYRANGADVPRLKEDVIEEIEQLALFKYKAAPHWGKNRPLAFDGVTAKYPKMSEFLAVREAFDPQGVFSSDWSDAVLGLGGNVTSEDNYCALEGLCVCSEDRHCAPEKGYYCRRGKVYTKARVCRWETSSLNGIYKMIHVTQNCALNAWLVATVTTAVLKVKRFLACVVPPMLLA